MTISIDELLDHSFVISCNDKRYEIFKEAFTRHGINACKIKVFPGFKLNYRSSITKDYKLPDLTLPIIGVSFSHAAIIAMA